ncbi:MAG: DUF5818 domain-containing protein [Pacificimonas sp.]
MSIGSHHIETGSLVRDGRMLVLRRDEGGRWRIDPDPKTEAFIGERVRVEGTRVGFDILHVSAIEKLS